MKPQQNSFGVRLYRGSPERFGGAPLCTVATIGNFDGVHRGHQHLLSSVVREARARSAALKRPIAPALLTFFPHPSVVLGRAAAVPALTAFRQKLRLLGELGIEIVYLVRFSPAISSLSAEEFLRRYLIGGLNVEHLVLGPDTAIGRGRAGSLEVISSVMQSCGRTTAVVPFVEEGGERISSRGIRALISAGDISRAQSYLGRPYEIIGRVVRGDGRGKSIGFPTANLHFAPQLPPGAGVYATTTELNGQRHRSITNVGVRPTFNGTTLQIETHLLDFSADFYGERISVQFTKKIRDERRFSSVEMLRAQIENDIAEVRSLL